MKINYKFSLITILCFIGFTVVGTLSHELGHISVAKYFGYETTLHYGSMNWNGGSDYNKLIEFYDRNMDSIKSENDNSIKTEWRIKSEIYRNQHSNDYFWITLGGTLQTMLVGCVGLIILYFRKNKWKINFKLFDWFSVYLSLFWLREIFNFAHSLVGGILLLNFPKCRGDEGRLSAHFNLPNISIPLFLGIIGFLVGYFVVFKVVPQEKRLNFFISGILGGISGFILWLNILGPILMP